MQEEWRSIEGYEGKYEVSSLGRVKSLSDNKGRERELILVPRIAKNGYLYLNLWKGSKAKSRKIHRLVAETFIKRPSGAQCVNHKNGVKTDNRLENLEWCTYSQNTKHAYTNGLIKPTDGCNNGMYGRHGVEHPSSKRVEQYTLDGEHIGTWDSCIEAGKALGVNGANIQRCARGDRKTAHGYLWKYSEC